MPVKHPFGPSQEPGHAGVMPPRYRAVPPPPEPELEPDSEPEPEQVEDKPKTRRKPAAKKTDES